MDKNIRKIVREEIGVIMNNKRRLLNNERLNKVFSSVEINEENVTTKDALEKIRKGDFENQDAKRFKEALNKSKHSKMLTDYTVDELSKMKLFKINGFDIGFALKKSEYTGDLDEIVAVFNNESEVKGIGIDLMKQAIKQGGCFLDHFDGFLTKFYEQLGFLEYKRDEFDPKYDEDGSFAKKYGESDIIYRKHKNC